MYAFLNKDLLSFAAYLQFLSRICWFHGINDPTVGVKDQDSIITINESLKVDDNFLCVILSNYLFFCLLDKRSKKEYINYLSND